METPFRAADYLLKKKPRGKNTVGLVRSEFY